MNLIDLQEELQIKEDINLNNAEGLLNKYGNNIQSSISFVRTVNKLFSKFSHYPFYVFDEFPKIKEVTEKLSEKYDSDILRTACKTLNSKIDRELKYAPTNKEQNALRDQALALRTEELGGLVSTVNFNYKNIISTLNEELDAYNAFEFKDYYYLNAKTIKNSFTKYNSLKNSSADFDLVKTYRKIYCDNPLLHFCYDEKFLVLTNYIINSNVDEEIKEKISNIAKNVIDVSVRVNPNVDFIKNYNKKSYTKLARFTANTIKKYEKQRSKEMKLEEQEAKKEIDKILKKSL